jgi:hypothetical protein
VPDARLALEPVVRLLRPGGALLLQEYFDWGAMKLVPRSAAFDRAVSACGRGWTSRGATIDVGERLPALALELGLRVERFEPIARAGRPGSLVWQWVSAFLHTWLPKLVESGELAPADLDAWRADHARRAADPATWLYAPTMADAILRKP